MQLHSRPDAMLAALYNPAAQVLGFCCCFFLILSGTIFFGPVTSYGVPAAVFFSLMIVTGSAALLIGISFWFRMLALAPMWGVMTLFFPGLIYRYVYLNWDDYAVRKQTVIQIVALTAFVGSVILLSQASGRSIETVLAFQRRPYLSEENHSHDRYHYQYDDEQDNW